MPATVSHTSFVPILQAIENRLVAKGVVSAANLVKWWVGRTQPPNLDSQFDVVMWVRGFTSPPVPSTQTGGGQFTARLTRRLDIVPRVRMALDEIDRVKLWLSGSGTDPGYFPTEDAVIQWLLMFWPQDAAGNQLTICPLHLLSGIDPDKSGDAWGWGSVSFEVQYKCLVNLTFS